MAYRTDPYSNPHIESLLSRFVDPQTQRVRFPTLKETDRFLHDAGFALSWKEEWGPKGGWMLYYMSRGLEGGGSGLMIRIKTHGDAKGPRAFKPHLSVTWTEGGIDYIPHEKGKYNPHGRREPKSPPPEGGRTADAWGDRTHPLFPGFEGSCAEDPRGLYGGETIEEDGAKA